MPVQSTKQIAATRPTPASAPPAPAQAKLDIPKKVAQVARQMELGTPKSTRDLKDGSFEVRYASASIVGYRGGEFFVKAQPTQVDDLAKKQQLGLLEGVYNNGKATLYVYGEGSVELNKKTGSARLLKPHLHTVKPGDTLNALAKKYMLQPSEMAAMNQIKNPDKIKVGDTFYSGKQQVLINPGDTLSKLAKEFNTDVATLKTLNNLTDANKISAGKMLLVPVFEGCFV